MIRTLSAEFLSRKIRVNAISPGPVTTPLYNKLGIPADQLEQTANGIRNLVPIGRFCTMENIFYEWIKAGQEQAEITQAFSAQALARHLYNSYNGMRIIGQTKPDRKSLEDIIKVALSVLTVHAGE